MELDAAEHTAPLEVYAEFMRRPLDGMENLRTLIE
jgi:hypothetical protein